MITRNGTDTIIGIIPGPDVAAAAGTHTGDLYKALKAFQTWAGWATEPALGDYCYPSGGSSETFDFQRGQGAAVGSWRSIAIPNGKTIADVHLGNCDAIWTARAQAMVATGQASGFYFPGYEGNGKNFSGSALFPQSDTNYGKVINGVRVVGEVEWAYAVSRQIRVMRAVTGWNCWVGINFSVTNATKNGLDPNLAFSSITEPFQSVDMDIYDEDDFTGTFSATDAVATWNYLLTQLTAQKAMATTYGVPVGLGEFGAMWRSDGHAGGDRIAVLQNLQQWILDPANNVSHAFMYDGQNLPGDNCRFATPTKTTDGAGINSYTYATTTTQSGTTPSGGFPNVAAAVKTLFDPALFVNKAPTVAALQAQIVNLQATITAQQATITSLQTQIAATGGTSQLTLRQLLAAYQAQLEASENSNATALAAAQASAASLAAQQTTMVDQVSKIKAALAVAPTP